MPVYNQFRKSDTGQPIDTDGIPEERGANLFKPGNKKALATKAGQKQQRQRSDMTPQKRGPKHKIPPPHLPGNDQNYTQLMAHQSLPMVIIPA